ncbi:MAG TPA: AMP-binding protein [Terriglobales bacterium]|jgi:long-chain acyl-CoA synthetase
MEDRSLLEYLARFLELGSETAYVQKRGYRRESWTYRQVAQTAFQFARELESRNIGKGDRVLIWGPNRAEWVAAFFGCVARGVIVVPMDDAATTDFAQRVFRQVGAKLTVCSRAHINPGMPSVILEELTARVSHHSADKYPRTDLAANDTLEIVFTSGTTADPKGVIISHGNVVGNVTPLEDEIRKYLKYEHWVHPVRFLNLLPLSHVFGQFLGIFLPQLLAGTVIFQDALNPTELVATIRRERVSVIVAVPRLLQSLKEKIERDLQEEEQYESFQQRYRLSEGKHFLRRWWIFRDIHRRFGWKFWAFICGGAALDSVTEEFWGRLGYAVVQGYGLTETTSLVSVNHPFRLGKGSIGKVLAGREVKLAPDGEILVRGSGVVSGYWQGESLQGASSEADWYHTGDAGEFDAAGNLYFKGRKKSVIVTPAGMNVYPEDLEGALKRQPEVKDCVVVPFAQQQNAEPCAVLILRDTSNPTGVVSRANQELAEYQKIRNWFVWPEDDFPRTSTQKPRTNVIVERIEASRAGEPQNSSALSELISRVTGRTATPSSNLDADLNLSSLDRVELMSALEDRYQIDLSETSFSALNTVADLEALLNGGSSIRAVYHYPAWAQRWPITWIRFITNYTLLLPAVFLLGWPRIRGRENLRGLSGPVLVISNHIGDIDVGFVLMALPARLRNRLATATGGEALQILRTPSASRNLIVRAYDRVKWFLGVSLLNLFPLPREAGFRQSFAYAGESVDRGYSVLVFPEGHHTKDGKMLPFRTGIGLLANNLQIPIVPTRIDGLFELKKAGKKIARPHAVTITIGKPVQFEAGKDPAQIARELQEKIEELQEQHKEGT